MTDIYFFTELSKLTPQTISEKYGAVDGLIAKQYSEQVLDRIFIPYVKSKIVSETKNITLK